MKIKLNVIVIVHMLIIVSAFASIAIAEENENEIQWPTSWIQIDSDPIEDGNTHAYRDVEYAFYGVDDEYLYFRLECYGSPSFTAEPEVRYKWFIDIDDPHNMGQSGGKVYDAEYVLFVEDSPKPGGDGIGDIYLLNDVNDDGFIGDDWPDYLITPGKINDNSLASYRIENNCIDVCIKLTEISDPLYSYFTWATDQENPNIDQAPEIDRSNDYWDTDLSKADLSIVKTDSADPISPGDSFTYSLLVTNHGPHAAENIVVSDMLPADVTFLSADPAPSGNVGQIYNWTRALLNSGESFVIEINVLADAMGTMVNTAQVTSDVLDLIPDNNEDRVETIVRGIADLSIEKTSEFVAPAHAGSLILYTLNVTNHGPDVALDVNVTDILPHGVTFVDALPMADEIIGSEYRWVIPSISAGESVIIKINVTVNDSFYGVITNLAYVDDDSYDPDDGNDEDGEDIIVDESDDDNNGGGGGGSGGGSGGSSGGLPKPDEYKEPIAKTDGPYYALVGEEIQFNGTDSHDNDEDGESIDRYDWKFSDGGEWHNDSGAIPTYTYNESGRYNVSLRVFDDEGTSNINTTFALISKLNSAPSQPVVTGPTNGTKNVYYNFTVVSTDQNEDDIKYTIDWGDGNTTESVFLPSGVPFNAAYKWIDSGKYTIEISADDNSTVTTDDFIIEIIDPDPEPSKAKENDDMIPLFLLLLLLLILLILTYLLYKRRRDKKKIEENPISGAQSNQ